MVNTIYPVDAAAGAPSYGGRMLRQVNAVAFAGASSTRPLGGRSGVRPGTSTTTVSATSTTWTCAAFSGVADVEAAAESGLVTFSCDAVQTGSITAASASIARQDLIYVQIDIPVEDGSTVPVATVKYIAGTVASTDPALPVSRAFAIARINVPVSGGGSPTVTWIAPYAVAAGGIIPVRNTTERDLLIPLARTDNPIYADIAGVLYVSTGGAFVTAAGVSSAGKLTASSGAIAGTAAPAGTVLLKQTITGVYASGAAGRWAIAYPATFPNGLLSAQLTLLNGDTYGAALNFYGTPTQSTATVQILSLSTGAAVPSINPRISLVLEGW
ncbi:MAG: hypothetical protein H7288_11450 [Kineosporiaceae bacterium]|nr:hypothetical protein [Aeromicrobium sp.]